MASFSFKFYLSTFLYLSVTAIIGLSPIITHYNMVCTFSNVLEKAKAGEIPLLNTISIYSIIWMVKEIEVVTSL